MTTRHSTNGAPFTLSRRSFQRRRKRRRRAIFVETGPKKIPKLPPERHIQPMASPLPAQERDRPFDVVKTIIRIFQFVPVLFCMLVTVSCERRTHFVFWSDVDDFCDGKVFSICLDKEEGIQAVQFLEHGSGYRASSQSDSWLVQWKIDALKEGQTNYPANIIYLGHHEVIQKLHVPDPVHESGVELATFRSGPDTNYVVREEYGFKQSDVVEVFKVSGQTVGQSLGKIEASGVDRAVFNRSRREFFAWKPFPAIYACSNLSVVKRIPLTGHFKEFDSEFHRVENHLAVLTDDLRFLIAVPFNGGESPQGFNHYKAYCYDFSSDEVTAKTIHFGTNDTAISAIENVDNDLLFIAYDDSEKLALLNSGSKVLAELPSEDTRFFNFGSNFHWVYEKKCVFISKSKIDLDAAHREVVLRSYDYDKGQKKQFILNAGEMKIPQLKP
ncbi:MAG TPA: hypothetical protein VK815_10250 [Candidatus Acidoferrales bacterium]|nr:hypothetical protein [Candidatus Acidoferrales bacterium]